DVALIPGVAGAVLARLKACEQSGYAFESAEASVALMLRREEPTYRPPFELVDYKVLLGGPAGSDGGGDDGGDAFADAAIRVRIVGQVHHTAAGGNGPVNA